MSAWKCAASQIRLAPVEALVSRVGWVEDIRPSFVAEGQRVVGRVAVGECVVVATARGQAFHRHPDTLTLSQPHPHTKCLLQKDRWTERQEGQSNVEDKQIM